MEKTATELMARHSATTRIQAACRDWKQGRPTPEEKIAFQAGAEWAVQQLQKSFDLKSKISDADLLWEAFDKFMRGNC